jgi:hypothetical protein
MAHASLFDASLSLYQIARHTTSDARAKDHLGPPTRDAGRPAVDHRLDHTVPAGHGLILNPPCADCVGAGTRPHPPTLARDRLSPGGLVSACIQPLG